MKIIAAVCNYVLFVLLFIAVMVVRVYRTLEYQTPRYFRLIWSDLREDVIDHIKRTKCMIQKDAPTDSKDVA